MEVTAARHQPGINPKLRYFSQAAAAAITTNRKKSFICCCCFHPFSFFFSIASTNVSSFCLSLFHIILPLSLGWWLVEATFAECFCGRPLFTIITAVCHCHKKRESLLLLLSQSKHGHHQSSFSFIIIIMDAKVRFYPALSFSRHFAKNLYVPFFFFARASCLP